MIFKVSDKCKGSVSLASIKKVFTAGMTVSIDESKLLYNDIKMAIRSGILIPADEKEYKKKFSQQNSTVLVRNKSKKTVVLGEIVIKPLSIVAVDRNIVKEELFFNAQESGLIELVSKDGKVIIQTPVIDTRPEITRIGDMEDELEEVEIEDPENKEEDISDVEVQEVISSSLAEENPVTPTVWDFRTQQSVEAEKVQKTECVDKVDNDDEDEEEEAEGAEQELEIAPEPIREVPEPIKEETVIDDIFEESIVEKIEEKIIEAPVVIKKETRGRKKKENTVKKQNNIKPVGEQRVEKTAVDAEQDLDSRGQPVKKASDVIAKMINALSKDEESEMFVDRQQELDRLKKRLEDESD
jgi:hypothetical protein